MTGGREGREGEGRRKVGERGEMKGRRRICGREEGVTTSMSLFYRCS